MRPAMGRLTPMTLSMRRWFLDPVLSNLECLGMRLYSKCCVLFFETTILNIIVGHWLVKHLMKYTINCHMVNFLQHFWGECAHWQSRLVETHWPQLQVCHPWSTTHRWRYHRSKSRCGWNDACCCSGKCAQPTEGLLTQLDGSGVLGVVLFVLIKNTIVIVEINVAVCSYTKVSGYIIMLSLVVSCWIKPFWYVMCWSYRSKPSII